MITIDECFQLVSEDGSEVAEGKPGELLLKGRSVFSGYRGQEDSGVDGQGWFRTGYYSFLCSIKKDNTCDSDFC